MVLVPVANPPAFNAGTRLSPLDAINLNRVFPGDATGSISERLAYTLWTEVIAAADAAGLAMVFTGMRHFRH